MLTLPGACAVEQGDNIVAPYISLDDDFFFCRVQPDVISAMGCASGGALGGSCHGTSVTSLRLDVAAETDPRPTCVDGAVVGAVPISYERNLEAARFAVQIDLQSSTLYTSPTGIGSHPRVIFQEDSAEAQIIADWINGGAP